MFSLLNPTLWLVALAILAGSSGLSYFKGRTNGMQVCEARHAAATVLANDEARKREQHRETILGKARNAATTRSSRNAAAVSNIATADDRLRKQLDETERRAKDSAAAAAITISTYRELFDSCREEYKALGAEAAGHASDSLMYQEGWPTE